MELDHRHIRAGIELSKCNPCHCIYVEPDHQGMIFVALYVDDLVLASNNFGMIKATKHALSEWFHMTYLGEIRYFRGMKVDHDLSAGTFLIYQTKIAEENLQNFGMKNSNPFKSSQEPVIKLTRSMCTDGCNHDNIAIGCLMYRMVGTRPDLSDAVVVISQFLMDSCQTH